MVPHFLAPESRAYGTDPGRASYRGKRDAAPGCAACEGPHPAICRK